MGGWESPAYGGGHTRNSVGRTTVRNKGPGMWDWILCRLVTQPAWLQREHEFGISPSGQPGLPGSHGMELEHHDGVSEISIIA